MNRRAKVIVFGRVQGAAYRDNVERIAYELDVTGTVRNLDDGAVEIICEGNDKSLSQFLKRIQIQRWPIIVRNMQTRYQKPTNEFREFHVIRGKESTRDILERLDLGMNYMSEMNEKQDLTISSIKTMDGNIKTMDGDIKSMNSNMSGHFDNLNSNMSGHFNRLDHKYGEFGKTMKGVARDIKGVKGSMKGVAKDIKAIRKAASTAAPPLRRSRRKTSSASTT